jgi:hypothetical protein
MYSESTILKAYKDVVVANFTSQERYKSHKSTVKSDSSFQITSFSIIRAKSLFTVGGTNEN